MSCQQLLTKVTVTLDGIHLYRVGQLVALLMFAGCSSDVDDRTHGSLSGAAESPIEARDNTTLGASIKAGYGIPSCHIGMPVAELGIDWERVSEPDLSNELQFNKKSGLYIQEESGKVKSVEFRYADDELAPYQGSTHEGISATSSLNDVREKYGEPSYILQATRSDIGSFPNSEETNIDYVERGIQFQFIEDRLVSIAVLTPEKTFDYERFEKSMKRWIVFIRK